MTARHPDAPYPDDPDGRCVAETKSGDRCPQGIWRGSDEFCWVHDPEIADVREEAHRRGAKKTNARWALGNPPTKTLETIEDARAWMAWLARVAVSSGEVSAQRISAIRKTIKDFIDAHEKAELEARIEVLRERLEEHGVDV